MRALLILAHPNPDSFCHAIAARTEAGLRRGGHDVIVHDLGAEGFRAAMSDAERTAYHGDTPVLDPLVAQHIDDLRACEILVVVYPTWWSSLPAVLKGWFERVMVPGVGFVFDEQHKVRPGVTHIRRLVGISTYGSPWWYVKLVNDNGRRTVLRSMRLSTGLRTRSTWLACYGVDGSETAAREAFLDRCERRMAKL
jgi:putative NADPH-quinone reductase